MSLSIKQKLFRGTIWNSLSQFGSQGMNFVVMLILASLLEPADFGLIGMVVVITDFLGYFTEFGFLASLIQKKEIDELDCNTFFWSSVGFALILYGIVFSGAPLVSLFYGDDQLTLITQVVFLGFLSRPFEFMPRLLETKALNYNKLAKSELACVFVGGLVAVTMAFLGYGVWSLVVQYIVRDFIRVIVLNILVPWMPSFSFSYQRFKQHFTVGLHFTANNLIKFSIENFDYLLVGKLLGPSALGIYTLAFRLARYPLEKIWYIFGKMLFPAFSKLQDEFEQLRQSLVQISILGGFVVIPYLIFVFFGIEYLIPILGEKWNPTVPIIRIFVGYLLLFGVSMADEPLLFALGYVRTVNVLKSINVAFLVGVGFVAIKMFGLFGMAYTYTLLTSLYIIGTKYRTLQILRFRISHFMIGIRSVFVLSSVLLLSLGLATFFVRQFSQNSWVIVSVQGFMVVLVLLGLILWYGLIDIKNTKIDFGRVRQVSSYPRDES